MLQRNPGILTAVSSLAVKNKMIIWNRNIAIVNLITNVLLILFYECFAVGQNILRLNTVSNSEAVIELQNIDPIVGLQLTIITKEGISINNLQSINRLENKEWLVNSNIENDTALTFVAINIYLEPLPVGSGSIVKISFSKKNNFSGGSINFRIINVVLSDNKGKSLPFKIIPTENYFATKEPTWEYEYDLKNFPNPFNPKTTITYRIERTAYVRLIIYDALGRMVKTLYDDLQTEGLHSIVWNSTDERNQYVASGTYFYRLVVNGKAITKTLLVEK